MFTSITAGHIFEKFAIYNARVISIRKAHIMPLIDSSTTLADPLLLAPVEEADATGTLAVALPLPDTDDGVAELVVAASFLAFLV